MAKPKRKASKKKPTFNPKDARPKLLPGIIFLGLSILTFVSIWDYQPEQSPFITTSAEDIREGAAEKTVADSTGAKNKVGTFGAFVGFWALRMVGFAAWLIPIYLLWFSYMYFFSNSHKVRVPKYIAILASLASAAAIANMLESESLKKAIDNDMYTAGFGGILGDLIFANLLAKMLGTFGGVLVLAAIFFGGTFILLHDNLARAGWKEKLEKWKDARRERVEQKRAQEESEEKAKATPTKAKPLPKRPGREIPALRDSAGEDESEAAAGAAESQSESKPPIEEQEKAVLEIGGIPAARPKSSQGSGLRIKSEAQRSGGRSRGALKIVAGETTEKASVPLPEKKGDYLFPSLSLLQQEAPRDMGQSAEDHQAVAEALVRTLTEFGVKVSMGEVHTGPVITRYEVLPAAGVRVEKIINLDKNIALGLKAASVRILAPVPGKGSVGIEVPNSSPSPVSIREILESTAWAESGAEIPVALGREVTGKPLVADLAKMPHLLIAGATGSGKTVCISAIITSLLYHAGPDELRFVMIDPKIVELQIYNDLPHMLIPVVTDPKKVPFALKYLISEMEHRYKVFAKIGVRNIASFNAKRAEDVKGSVADKELEADLTPEERVAAGNIEVPRDEDIDIPEKLPYIVCIVDELADLMMVAPADIETCIARLSQLARATGIHLIIATQRPSVNVITGVIKANLPSRIAFKVASKVDSRTILDAMGADHLIGRGDMLFLPPGSSDLIRSQGVFVSDNEIKKIVNFLKQKGPPEFDDEFQQTVESGELAGESVIAEESDDKLVPDAIEVIRATKRASTSMLQRRLRIGYNRAARIMEMLEEKGIVGPENGAQPREILKDLDAL